MSVRTVYAIRSRQVEQSRAGVCEPGLFRQAEPGEQLRESRLLPQTIEGRVGLQQRQLPGLAVDGPLQPIECPLQSARPM